MNILKENEAKQDIIEEIDCLRSIKKEKKKEIEDIDKMVNILENEVQAYKNYKKQLYKKSLINILQITTTFLTFIALFNFSNMIPFISLSKNTLHIINLLLNLSIIVGNGSILAILNFDIKSYKKDNHYKSNWIKSNIKNYCNIKSDTENYVLELNNEIKNNINKLKKIYNSLNNNIEKKYNTIENNTIEKTYKKVNRR